VRFVDDTEGRDFGVCRGGLLRRRKSSHKKESADTCESP
jgi:hypothetical protein